MFGKPEWFVEKSRGWGIKPVTLQGWAYIGVWAAGIAGPFLLLLSMWRLPEALIWMAVAIGGMFLDVRSILKQIRQTRERDNLYFIGEDADSHVATKNYELQVREERRVS